VGCRPPSRMSLTEEITPELVKKELNQVLNDLNRIPGQQVSKQKRAYMNNLMSNHFTADEPFARVAFTEMFGGHRDAIGEGLNMFKRQLKLDDQKERMRRKLERNKAKG
jgi:hypothetical protein